MARRRVKALRGGRRQLRRRRTEKIRAWLAWPDEELRLCEEGDANRGAAGPDWAGQKDVYKRQK